MNVAKWLLMAILLLPAAELAAFIAVAAAVGILWALALVAASSLAGALILRHAGGMHIARIRAAVDGGSISALHADSTGALTLLAGILLLIPGFITDTLGLLLLLAPLGRALRGGHGGAPAPDGVVDLPPEQWHRVPDPELPDRRNEERRDE